jgi:hypothetical protein
VEYGGGGVRVAKGWGGGLGVLDARGIPGVCTFMMAFGQGMGEDGVVAALKLAGRESEAANDGESCSKIRQNKATSDSISLFCVVDSTSTMPTYKTHKHLRSRHMSTH